MFHYPVRYVLTELRKGFRFLTLLHQGLIFLKESRNASQTRLFPQPPILLFVSVCIKELQNERDPH